MGINWYHGVLEGITGVLLVLLAVVAVVAFIVMCRRLQ